VSESNLDCEDEPCRREGCDNVATTTVQLKPGQTAFASCEECAELVDSVKEWSK